MPPPLPLPPFPSILHGLLDWAHVLRTLLLHPRLLFCALRHTPLLLLCAALFSAALLIATLPLRLLAVVPVNFASTALHLLFPVAALPVLRFFLPHALCATWFAVLRETDSALHDELHDKPVVAGLVRQLLQLVAGCSLALLVLGAGAGALVFTPALAILAGAVLATPVGWAVLGGVAVAIAAVGTAALGWCLAPCLALFASLRSILDPVLALVLACSVLLGVLQGDVLLLIKHGVVMFFYSTQVTRALMAQAAIRSPRGEWNTFCHRHRFEIFGFGLPVYALFTVGSPLVGLVLMELLQGAAAVHWARVVGRENGRRRAGKTRDDGGEGAGYRCE